MFFCLFVLFFFFFFFNDTATTEIYTLSLHDALPICEYFAVGNRCPHEGASLCKGRIVGLVESSEPGSYQFSRRGELLRCPWHGWEFDLRTGKSWCEPDRTKVRSFELKVESG